MNNKIVLTVFISLLLVLVYVISRPPVIFPNEELGEFAQCLTDKGFVMYGADWCPHCQEEKKAFGDSFEKIKYIECPENIQACLDVGINGYPTWIAQNGVFLEGRQGIDRLAQVSGCELPR